MKPSCWRIVLPATGLVVDGWIRLGAQMVMQIMNMLRVRA